MRRFAVISLFGIFLSACHASAATSDDDYSADYAAAKTPQTALKANDKKTVATLVPYPYEREYPLPAITNAQDFVANWGDFFDADFTQKIVNDKAEQIGWRGIQLHHGMIWFADGKIRALNHRTAAFEKKYAALRTAEAANLYPALQGYLARPAQCSTKQHTIRIQQHADGFHYFAWKRGASMRGKPDLILTKGEQVYEGNGGNSHYAFRNGAYRYTLSEPVLCAESCDKILSVFKGEKELSSQICE
jgi:hypothetical protein